MAVTVPLHELQPLENLVQSFQHALAIIELTTFYGNPLNPVHA